jgi:hypothetical protein
MKKLGVVIFLVIFGSVAFSQTSGLLLGLAGSGCAENDCSNYMRTLWIAPQGAAVKLVATVPDIIVPRQDGFWRVGVRVVCDAPEDWGIAQYDSLFAVKVRERPEFKDKVSCEDATKDAEASYAQLMETKKAHAADGKSEDVDAGFAEIHGGATICNECGVPESPIHLGFRLL